MKLFKKVIIASKDIPKPVLVAAAVLPWGLTALGAWLVVKAGYNRIRGKND